MTEIMTIGLDSAKTVFQVHAADSEGRPVLRKRLRRGQVLGFFASAPACLVGLEACASAHYWARELQALGHEVRLIPPQDEQERRGGCGGDLRGAVASDQAVCHSEERRSAISADAASRARVAGAPAYDADQRLVIAASSASLPPREPVEVIEDPDDCRLPSLARAALVSLVAQLHAVEERIAELEKRLMAWHRSSEASLRLATIPGVGVITATALVATVGGTAVPLGPTVRRLVGTGAAPAIEWRQGPAWPHLEAR